MIDAENAAKACVVGAGVSGLATAKVLLADGFDVDVLEKKSGLGGTWHPSRTYPGHRTNDPKELYRFSDFPYPESADEFPTADQVRSYLESYADHFDLRRHMRFSTEVASVGRTVTEGRRFQVTVRPVDGSGAPEERRYDHVVLCNGVFSDPHVPHIGGEERFQGERLHSSELTDRSQLAGKRAIIVGGGKSAYDCATVTADHADSCALVYRSPHWLGPRYLMGLREDWFVATRFVQAFFPYHTKRGLAAWLQGPGKPLVRLYWRFQTWLIKTVLRMPPVLVPDESLPVGFQNIGTGREFYDRVREGKVVPRRDQLDSFIDGETLKLKSGEEIKADVIIFATGWEQRLDLLEPELRALVFQDHFFMLYRHILAPDERHLGFVGYASSIGNMLTSEISAHWLSSVFLGRMDLPPPGEMYAQIERVRRWTEEMLPGSGGFLIGPYIVDYLDELMRDMGLSTHRVSNPLEEYFGRFHAERFCGIGEEIARRTVNRG